MVPPSVYQMMRGSIVVICALFSIIFLKRKQYRHHWTGLACIVFGEIAIGFTTIRASKNDDEEGSELFGIILLVTA